MKISNSKKQLSRIINENGDWRDGAEFAAQGRNRNAIGFCASKPKRINAVWGVPGHKFIGVIYPNRLLPHWHQTILSREEYFHLYPAPVKAVVESPEQRAKLAEIYKPSIEQLATDYRNAKDYANRKQQEADAAKADAEGKLAELAAAGSALGLVLSVAPTRKYTGEFYNSELGERPSYGEGAREAICDRCGKRYGAHFGYNCQPGAANA